jgi:hypothetical protein
MISKSLVLRQAFTPFFPVLWMLTVRGSSAVSVQADSGMGGVPRHTNQSRRTADYRMSPLL